MSRDDLIQPVNDDDGMRVALREMLKVALPAIVTMLSYTAMQFVDLLIVSRLGGQAMSAVGNGTVVAFLPAAAMFGVVGVISTYVSQNLGAGTPERGSAYAWNGLWITLGVWVLVLLPFAALLPQVQATMRAALELTIDQEVRVLEVVYGRIVLVGMVFTIAARTLSHYFFGIHRPLVVMLAALVANGLNLPITWALVNGEWGMPSLGVAGAAIGTVIGSFVEVAILMSVFLSAPFNRAFGTRGAWRFSRRAFGDIWRIGWPAGLMFGNELICWWVFMAGLIASFGVIHNTAGFIVLRYMHLSFMPAVGLSMAVAAVVGKAIGAGKLDEAARRTKLGLALGMAYMGTCALAMVIFREPAVRLFIAAVPSDGVMGSPEAIEEIVRLGSGLLILAAAFQLFDALAIILIGALRGAGDTLWPGILTIVLSWSLIVGLGWQLTERAPELGSLGPWIGAAAYIIVLSVAILIRYASGAWRSIDLLARSPVERAIPLDAGEGVMPELPAVDAAISDPAPAGGIEKTPKEP